MNNSIADWNMIVSEDNFLKKIDLLNRKISNLNCLSEKIDKLENKLNTIIKIKNNEAIQEDKNGYNILERKIDLLLEKISKIDEKIDLVNTNNSNESNNLSLDISKYINNENKSNENKSNKDIDNDNIELIKNICIENIDENLDNLDSNLDTLNNNTFTNNFFNMNSLSFNSIGLKYFSNENNAQERIKNTLWRRNIINYNNNNYYTTTPNIKFNIN